MLISESAVAIFFGVLVGEITCRRRRRAQDLDADLWVCVGFVLQFGAGVLIFYPMVRLERCRVLCWGL